MSDSGKSGREWQFYIDGMIGLAEKVLAYMEGLDQAGFVASVMTHDATLRNLELIGEPATHIPDEVRGEHPQIPSRMIIATRNCLIHARLGIDDDMIWSIVREDTPNLLAALKQLNKQGISGTLTMARKPKQKNVSCACLSGLGGRTGHSRRQLTPLRAQALHLFYEFVRSIRMWLLKDGKTLCYVFYRIQNYTESSWYGKP